MCMHTSSNTSCLYRKLDRKNIMAFLFRMLKTKGGLSSRREKWKKARSQKYNSREQLLGSSQSKCLTMIQEKALQCRGTQLGGQKESSHSKCAQQSIAEGQGGRKEQKVSLHLQDELLMTEGIMSLSRGDLEFWFLVNSDHSINGNRVIRVVKISRQTELRVLLLMLIRRGDLKDERSPPLLPTSTVLGKLLRVFTHLSLSLCDEGNSF